MQQTLYDHVMAIAKEFQDDRDAWIAAAKDFRMPYWDWADPKGSIYPEDTLVETLDVIQPQSKGIPKPVPNPLYAYKFQQAKQKGTVCHFTLPLAGCRGSLTFTS